MKPERFGRYEVQAEIGHGAMGCVYRAHDPVVGRTVAIKTVKTEHLSRQEAPEYMKRFQREVQAAGALSHPHIVRIFDVGDGYLVMEHLEGRTLQDLLKEKGRIEPEEALRILAPVADAIDHAHRMGVVHRDIKPSNIMVLADGRPKLMDFGVAHLESSVMTSAGQILGSPSYMAPEQVAGQEVTSRTDVYALGVVAYEILTGQRPFQGSNVTKVTDKIANEPAPLPCSLNAALPSRYDDLFPRVLAKDPARRFPTASAFVAALDLKELEEAIVGALEPAVAAPVPPAPPPVAPSPAPRRIHLPNPPFALATGALLVVVLTGLWLVRPAPAPRVEPPPSSEAPAAAPRASPSPSRAPRPSPTAFAEGALVEMGADVVPPRRVSGGPASYPPDARRRRQEGAVTVSMIVTETGEPIDIRIVDSAGPLLDEATLEAVRSWRFEPARKDGVKVRVRWVVTQRFTLER